MVLSHIKITFIDLEPFVQRSLLVYSGFSVWLKFTVGRKCYGIYKISAVVVLTTVAYNKLINKEKWSSRILQKTQKSAPSIFLLLER